MGKHSGRAKHSISRAVDFLDQSQLDYGEFETFAWRGDDHPEQGQFDSSPFVTCLVLHSIGYSNDDRVQAIAAKALDFICAEMEGSGLWRFWSSRNKRRALLPPDLDDTCCISFILKRYGKVVPANRELVLANRNSQGIFYTWVAARTDSPPELAAEIQRLVNPQVALVLSFTGVLDNIDCAVNANVLLYLGEIAQTEQAVAYLIDVVRAEREAACSHYYLDRLSFYYMLSRAFAHGAVSLAETRNAVVDRVLSTQAEDGAWGNELLTALAACTLLNFGQAGPPLDRGIESLLRLQRDDGSWRRVPMFLGRDPYYGSEALTTALCVEALARSV
jgi:hypothetical protein